MKEFNFDKLYTYICVLVNLIVINTLSMILLILSLGTLFGPVIVATDHANKKLTSDSLTVFKEYKKGFLTKFSITFRYSLISWAMIIIIIFVKVAYVGHLGAVLAQFVIVIYAVIIAIIAATNLYVYFMIGKYDLTLFRFYSESLALSVYKFPQTVVMMVINVMLAMIIVRLPAFMFIIIPIVVYFNSFIVTGILASLDQLKEQSDQQEA